MSDSSKYTSALTDEEINHAQRWFDDTFKKRNCDMCGSTEGYKFSSYLTTLVLFDRRLDRHRKDKVILVATYECDTCGNIKTISADKIGFGTKSSPGSFDK